jgi:orotate phosphoribosyltransferase
MAFPAVRRLIRDGLAALVDDHDLLPATIAGTATAGIPHAAWLAAATDQPMAYVRSAAKSHGTKARIEGALGAGESAVVVEDLISTGGSALDAVAALREAGVTVRAVLAIFSYQLDAADTAFREADVDRHVLTDFRTLVDVAHDEGRLSDADLDALSDWRADPEAWSAAHGGTRPA